MGGEVRAQCKCGVGATSRVGGGMMDFDTIAYFPCLCNQCQSVVEVNLRAKIPCCPRCQSTDVIPYDDQSLHFDPGLNSVTNLNLEEEFGRILSLKDGLYWCPKCREMTLRFWDTGLDWD